MSLLLVTAHRSGEHFPHNHLSPELSREQDTGGIINQTFGPFGMQKFIAVRKEDAGEYYCRAKNDAGYAECPPQLMEVCKCTTAARPERLLPPPAPHA